MGDEGSPALFLNHGGTEGKVHTEGGSTVDPTAKGVIRAFRSLRVSVIQKMPGCCLMHAHAEGKGECVAMPIVDPKHRHRLTRIENRDLIGGAGAGDNLGI